MTNLNPGGSRRVGHRLFSSSAIKRACDQNTGTGKDKAAGSIADRPHQGTREEQRRRKQYLANLRKKNPRWTISFEYGRWQAVHDNYEASWEGEEDGYVGNGWIAEGSDLVELAEEMLEVEEAKR